MANVREALGVVLVALTGSTILTLFLVGERSERYLEILENVFPLELRHDRRNTFSIAAIARKSIKYASIEIACLDRLDMAELGVSTDKSGREGMLSLQFISDLYHMARSLGLEPIEYGMESVENNVTRYSMYVFDFTDVLLPLVEASRLGGYMGAGVTTVYAGLFNQTGLAHLYGGCRDFFPARNSTITELTIVLNDRKEVYKRIKELSPEEIAAGTPTLLDAPGLGKASFSDLEKDDTARLSFSIDRATIPGYDSVLKVWRDQKLELVRIIVNGKVEDRMANFCFAT